MNRSSKLASVIVVTLLLFLPLFSVPFSSAPAPSDPSAKLYLAYDSANVVTGSVSTALTLNTTKFNSFSNIGSTSPTPIWTWFLDPELAGQIVVNGITNLDLYLSASATSSWKMNATFVWTNSGGTNLGTIAYATNTALNGLSTTTGLNTIALTNSASQPLTIGSTDLLKISLNFLNTTVTSASINVVMTTGLNSYIVLPLSVNPITVVSPSLSPQSIVNPSTSTATLSVSDAFGVYDIASATVSASTAGVTPINRQNMIANSGNSPTAFTGSWSAQVNPGATSYAGYSGEWSVSSTVTDQSGNSYNSNPSFLTYSGSSGGCVIVTSCTTTTSQHPGSGPTPPISSFEEYIIFAAVVIIVLLAIFALRRR